MPKELDFENLRLCIDNYPADFLYIRLISSKGGTVKVNGELGDKKLDFKKNKSGLHLLIDSKEVFCFPLIDYQKGFSLEYERILDGGRLYVGYGIADNPYDSNLPEPRRSFLRNVMDDHLIEIAFIGRIRIKFYSMWIEPYWKYWTINKPSSVQEIINK